MHTEATGEQLERDPRGRGKGLTKIIGSMGLGILSDKIRGHRKPLREPPSPEQLAHQREFAVEDALEVIVRDDAVLGRAIFEALSDHEDPALREQAAFMSAGLFTDKTEAYADPTLQRLLQDEDIEVRNSADAAALFAGTDQLPEGAVIY